MLLDLSPMVNSPTKLVDLSRGVPSVSEMRRVMKVSLSCSLSLRLLMPCGESTMITPFASPFFAFSTFLA